MSDTFRILLSTPAANDLTAIIEHIAVDSPQNARRVVERILTAIGSLKTFPHRNILSRQHLKLKHPVRTLPVQSWIVFFRVLEADRVVRILHVRHAARRRPKRFN